MITLTAKIDILSGDNGGLSLGTTNVSTNNISSDLSTVVGVKKVGKNPFIIGSSKLGDGSTFSNGVDYFISKQKTDSEGAFATPYSITINSTTAINGLAISFDTVNNVYPSSVLVNGRNYVVSNAKNYFGIASPSNSIKLEIGSLNKEESPLVITGIYLETSINIDRRNLISMSRSIFDRSDLKLPSFGIISNKGEIEFNDGDGRVLAYAEQLLLDSGLECKISLNNTLVEGASQSVAVMETDQWQYDNNNRVVSVTLKDDLEEWQDINVDGINYDPRNAESKPFKWLYEYLWGLTDKSRKGNYNMLSFSKLNDNTKNILENTYIQYPLLESGTLWQQWTKLCQACQLHIYKNNDGVVICRYNGGN